VKWTVHSRDMNLAVSRGSTRYVYQPSYFIYVIPLRLLIIFLSGGYYGLTTFGRLSIHAQSLAGPFASQYPCIDVMIYAMAAKRPYAV
jgi:hypothetical protein